MVPPRRQPIKIDWGRWEGQDRRGPLSSESEVWQREGQRWPPTRIPENQKGRHRWFFDFGLTRAV